MNYSFFNHPARGQVVPEFMVLAILALLLFFSAFVFYIHEQDLIRASDHDRSANRLAALLSDAVISVSRLPVGSSLSFSHTAPDSFRVEVNNHYLRIRDEKNTLVSRRLLADVQSVDAAWTGDVELIHEAGGIQLVFS